MLENTSSHDTLIRTHYKRVLSLCCFMLLDYQEAQDVTQEVFCKLVKARETRQPRRSWDAWLTRVATNACYDRRRSAWWLWQRDNAEELQEEALPSPTLSPEDCLLYQETVVRCQRVIAALPPRQREVFILRRFYGWSSAKVATTLGLTTGSVKRHLFHAMRHLQQGLREDPSYRIGS